MLNLASQSWRPRILIVGAFPPPNSKIFGGIVTSCNALLKSSLSSKAELVLLDSTQISNPPPIFAIRLLFAVRRIFTYLIRFERHRPDAVLLFTAVGASIVEKGAMAWYARIRGVPALMFPRGDIVSHNSRFSRLWVRFALGGARTILCQGPAWQRFAVDMLGFSLKDAPIVMNWTATSELLSIGQSRRYVATDRPVRLLFLGWLEREKGVFELVEACRQLSESRDFVLNFVGEGSVSEDLRLLVEKSKLDSIVQFSGWLKGLDLEAALSEADVFVLPSWAEGLPNAMIEAMAARLAVVVTAVGNIPDVVANEREALLVPPKNILALRYALERIIDTPALRCELADAAFLLAEQRFSIEQAADDILLAVNDTIGRFGNNINKQRMVS
jgi:glycosyltransferase involved in cell wall biosynthesis